MALGDLESQSPLSKSLRHIWIILRRGGENIHKINDHPSYTPNQKGFALNDTDLVLIFYLPQNHLTQHEVVASAFGTGLCNSCARGRDTNRRGPYTCWWNPCKWYDLFVYVLVQDSQYTYSRLQCLMYSLWWPDGDWSEWSECSATCGGGVSVRSIACYDTLYGRIVDPCREIHVSCNSVPCPEGQ